MFPSLLLGAALAFAPPSPTADAPPTVVRVVADDKPAAGATVWVYEYPRPAAEPTPLVADKEGKVRVPANATKARRQVAARDAAGRIGWRLLSPDRDEETDLLLPLVATSERAGRLTAADGKPVAGATVAPTGYHVEPTGRRAAKEPPINLPPWEERRLAVRTDADGRFKLRGPAVPYTVSYTVTADGHGETRWFAADGLDTALFAPGTVTVTTTGAPPAALKGTSVMLTADRTAGADKVAGGRPVRLFGAALDEAGRATIANVPPGRYELVAHPAATVPAVFEKAAAVEVTAGSAVAAVATFGPAAKVTGRITAKDTGKGLAGVRVILSVTDGETPIPRRQLFVDTDETGAFTAYGPAGWYLPWVDAPPDGFATPAPAQRRTSDDRVKIDAGKAHEFPPYPLLTAVTFAAVVRTADGKPAAGATVRPAFGLRGAGPATADRDGRFALKNLPPDDAVSPRVRLGTAVNEPKTYQLDQLDGPVKIELSEANAAAFKGRVTDAAGRPVAGAAVTLTRQVRQVGRNTDLYTTDPFGTATTDADGRYAFAGCWPGDRYRAQFAAAGHKADETKWITGEAGEAKEFPAVALAAGNLTVRGRVVGPDGGPLAGVEVASVDGPERVAVTTAADGGFTLVGLNAGAAFVTAARAGYRPAVSAVILPKANAVTISLSAADGRPVPPPAISPDHRAKLDAFTRHVLTLVLENHDAFGYGSAALANLARIDLPAAEKWRDDLKARTGGKTDFTRIIDRARRERTLFDTAKRDADEAAALLRDLPAADGFAEALQVGKQLLAADKAAAARLAEEAVAHARRLDTPRRVWALAEAGDLAARAGAAGGRKVLAEAADLAEKLEPERNGGNNYAIGTAAARLAPFDGPRADALLNRLPDARAYNQYLAAAAARVAATDLDRAKAMLGRMKADSGYSSQQARVRVALAVAAAKPAEALDLVNAVPAGQFRALGLTQLAGRFAATDKRRAAEAIDAAFAHLEANPDAFRSLLNFGGRAGVAVIVLVRAKEVGHPDVPALVARTLAMWFSGREAMAPQMREDQAVSFAAALALVDPAAARHVLAGVAPPNEFAAAALTRGRDWLFALALADPERATALADKLIARAKTDRTPRNALSTTGLVEVGDILCAKDTLTALTQWGHMLREVGDD